MGDVKRPQMLMRNGKLENAPIPMHQRLHLFRKSGGCATYRCDISVLVVPDKGFHFGHGILLQTLCLKRIRPTEI
jgi:hypothetical protein